MHSYSVIAMQLGVLFALVGIIWQCLQMVFGTLEQRKFLVGTITKWFLFLFCMTFYPAMSMGLKTFALEMGTFVSGGSTNAITEEFGKYLETLENALKADADDLNETISRLQKEKENRSFAENRFNSTYLSYGNMSGMGYYDPLIAELDSAEKKKQEIESIISSIDTDKPKGVARTINALKSVLIIDDTNITKKYSLDLAMKDVNGNDTGFLSPNAMLRMSVLAAQIMWQKTWEDDIMSKWEEDRATREKEHKYASKITPNIADFPFSRIFDLILCFVCEILEIVITCIEMIQYVMCIIEFVICITFGIVIIPCLLFDGLKDMAMKLLPALLSQTVKLAMITICMFFCCYTYLDITTTIIADTSVFNVWTFCYVVFTILLTFALCSNAPKLASALLTGQPQMSMGEFIQSAGAIVGGAKLASAATKSAVGNTARFAANRLGDVAAMAGGARAGRSLAGTSGGNKTLGAIGGAMQALGSRTGSRIRGKMQNAATTWGKKGGAGGMGGGSGVGGNQFDINQRGKGFGMTEKNQPQHRRDYAGHQNEQGNQSSLKEYLSSQYKDGFWGGFGEAYENRGKNKNPHPDSPVSGNVDTGNNFNPPSAFGGAGGLAPRPTPRPPMGGGGSSVSYSPPALPNHYVSDEELANMKSANID